MSDYVKVKSWHQLRDGSQSLTVCGLSVAARPTAPWQKPINGYASALSLNEKSCESCLRIMASRS